MCTCIFRGNVPDESVKTKSLVANDAHGIKIYTRKLVFLVFIDVVASFDQYEYGRHSGVCVWLFYPCIYEIQ